MTGVEEVAAATAAMEGMGMLGGAGEGALAAGALTPEVLGGLGAAGAGAGLGAGLEGLGGLGAMGAAGEAAGTSSAISGGAANPFSLMMGNFNSMYPMVGKGAGLLGRAMGSGLMGGQQSSASSGMLPRPQGQAPETSSQILGNRFAPQSLMQNSSQQQNPQMAQLLQIMQGGAPMDPATLLKLRQQGVAI